MGVTFLKVILKLSKNVLNGFLQDPSFIFLSIVLLSHGDIVERYFATINGGKWWQNKRNFDQNFVHCHCIFWFLPYTAVYGRNQKIQWQWTKFWSKLRLFCHHFPPLIVAKYLSTMSPWESKTMLRNMKLGSWRNPFSTFFDNFKMTFRKVTPTATIVNEKKFWHVLLGPWHMVVSIWGFSWP